MLSHNERRQAKYFSVGQVNVDQVQPGPQLTHPAQKTRQRARAHAVCSEVLFGAPRRGRRGGASSFVPLLYDSFVLLQLGYVKQ